MFTQRVKVLAAAGILCGALGAAAVGGAFAAPAPAAGSTPTPTAQTQTANPSNAQPGTQSTSGQASNGQKPEGPRGFRGGFGLVQPLATFLGISTTDLQTAFKNGQTLAQIAQAHGKTTDQLKTFLTDQQKTRLDTAVKNGKLTSAQETQMLTNFSNRLDQMINQKYQAPAPRGPRGGGFFDSNGIAQFLGISSTELRTALQNGQTLAQIAQAHGKSATDLKNYLLNQDSQRIDKLINQKFQFGNHQGKPAQNGAAPATTATPTAQ